MELYGKSVTHDPVGVDSEEMFINKGLWKKSSSQYRVKVRNAKVDGE